MKFLDKLFKKKIDIVLTIDSSNGFHLRPIAKFINEVKKFDAKITIISGKREVLATQVPKILALGLENGESFTLRCVGRDAEQSSEHLSSFFIQLMKDDIVIEEIKQEKEEYEADAIRGETISKGIATGVLTSYLRVQIKTHTVVCSTEEALSKTELVLNRLYQENKNKKEADIFLAQKELLASDAFQKNFQNIDEEIERLKGTKFESRIADYQDIKRRILSYIGEESSIYLDDPKESIVIADELLPSEVEELSKLSVAGVILQKGSITSHASILLRAFKIPSIICREKVSSTEEYFHSLLDASSGQLIEVPTEADFKKAEEKALVYKNQEKESYSKRLEPAKTSKGKEIEVLANITDIESAKEAKKQGADGVGLFRTEFLFTDTKPTLEEQTKAYREIFNLFDNITIRILDIGGDKSLPYVNILKEDNPFLGIRGVRFSLQEQKLFKEQLLAIFQAHNSKNIKIMFPMVSNIDEFIKAKNIAQTVAKENSINIENIKFGIMLEVPCVIFALKEFDKIVDFYSIGTNDLTQYLFAIDRTHPSLTADSTSPIIFTVLKQIIETVEKPISICGELAGLEEATSKLIDMGYKTLSVSSKLIPSLKEQIRNV